MSLRRFALAPLALVALGACEPEEEPVDTARDPVVDADGDGWAIPQDCDDAFPGINPGATEYCNNLDDDCDGVTDDSPTDGVTAWLDLDRDGWGDAATRALVCETFVDDPRPWVYLDGDCDDADIRVHPGSTESCGDDADEDCDGDNNDPDALGCVPWYEDRDGDGVGSAAVNCQCEAGGAWRASVSGDCDDDDAAVQTGCPGTGVRWTTDADISVFGDVADVQMGGAVAPGGDADGDGWPDLLVAAASVRGAASWYRFRGPFGATEDSSAATARIANDAWSVTNVVGADGAHDLDGDGATDLLFWGVGRVSRTGGEAWVFTGDPRGSLDVSLADAHVTGGNSSGAVTYEALALGDRGGDGIDDLAIGDSTQVYTWVYSGPVTGELTLSDAELTIQVSGQTLDDAGDLDGDGLPELIIGNSAIASGVVWVVPGSATGAINATATERIVGGGASTLVGRNVAGLGDIDGDGTGDLAVVGVSSAAKVWIFSGMPEGEIGVDAAIATITGPDIEQPLDGPGDVDVDGYADLWLGDPGESTRTPSAGAARLFYGPLLGSADLADADLSVYGLAEGDLAGAAVGGVGDLNLDGFPDLGLGAIGLETGAREAGGAYVFFGGPR